MSCQDHAGGSSKFLSLAPGTGVVVTAPEASTHFIMCPVSLMDGGDRLSGLCRRVLQVPVLPGTGVVATNLRVVPHLQHCASCPGVGGHRLQDPAGESSSWAPGSWSKPDPTQVAQGTGELRCSFGRVISPFQQRQSHQSTFDEHNYYLRKKCVWGTWVSQWVKPLPSAEVVIPRSWDRASNWAL